MPEPTAKEPVKNYITPSGLQRLRDELRFLLTRERPAVTEVVAWAAGNGDRSENADYQYGGRRSPALVREPEVTFATQLVDHRPHRMAGCRHSRRRLGRPRRVAPPHASAYSVMRNALRQYCK